MAVENTVPTEIEVFGVSYERYALQNLFLRLRRKLSITSVIEMPASGAKAMPSLYSLGFALAGCQVTLVDADPEGLALWQGLGLNEKLETLSSEQLSSALAEKRKWDVCWNFAVVPISGDPEALIERMSKCSKKWLMLVNVNRYNIGFNLHRMVHKLWKIPWTHGDLRFFSPFETAKFLRKNNLHNISWGVVDCPPWPDSPGFRDLRLHRQGDKPKKWISPYVDYLNKGKFPSWMRLVYVGEEFPIPKWLKLPYSHLYYIIGRVDHEEDRGSARPD